MLLQVTKPVRGKDVELKLVVTSQTTVDLQLSINISIQAMKHEGVPARNIQSEVKEVTIQQQKGDSSLPRWLNLKLPEVGLQIWVLVDLYFHTSPTISADVSIPVVVPVLSYAKAMQDCESLKVVARITDLQNPERVYLVKDDVVLADPPIFLTVSPRIVQKQTLMFDFQTFQTCFV